MIAKPDWKRVRSKVEDGQRVILRSCLHRGVRIWFEERWTIPTNEELPRLLHEAYWRSLGLAPTDPHEVDMRDLENNPGRDHARSSIEVLLKEIDALVEPTPEPVTP